MISLRKIQKENAGAPDPATDLRVGAGVKQSHGSEIKDTTKVVAREEYGKKKKCPECGGKGCSHCGDTGYHMKKEEAVSEGKKGLYANIHAKRKSGEAPAKPWGRLSCKGRFQEERKDCKEGRSIV